MASTIRVRTAPIRKPTLPRPLVPSRLVLGLAAGLVVPSFVWGQDPGSVPAELDEGSNDGRKTLAVLYFANHTGSARYEALGKGIAEMLVTDLASLPSLRLVERARLEELLAEAEFSRSDQADSRTAMEIGRVLAAQYVITGALTGIEPEFRLDGRLIRTETAEVLRTAHARGTGDRFFQIYEDLAEELLPGLELALSDEDRERLRETQERNRIADAETVLAYSDALDHYDQGDYVEALELMAVVVRRAPASALVELTFQHVQETARERARDAVREEGRSRLRRLLRPDRDGS